MNELKKLPFTIAQLLIPFLILLDAACWNPYVMSQDMVNYLIYAVIMIWFSFEVASIACMRFEDDYSMCSLRNKICFWIFSLLYFFTIPVLLYFYDQNLMPFMCMIIAWANIGFLNDYNFHDLNSDNIIANGMILVFMLGCFDLFRGEFASVGIWNYVIVGIAIVSIVLMVLANTGDPDFKKVE